MSAKSSIDLSEFFNDDDSEGHRFASFLRKRRGADQERKKCLFMDYETDQMSFEVQLEKLPIPQFNEVDKSALQMKKRKPENNLRNCENDVEVNKNFNGKSSDDKLSTDSPVAENIGFVNPKELLPMTESTTRHPVGADSSPIRSVISTRLGVRKGGGVNSPSDNLRRFSIKNCSSKKISVGRRTLLQEFENTMEGTTNFDPTTCSTPISQPTQHVPQLSLNSNPLTEIEITSENGCSHSETLRGTMLRKDAELKEYVEKLSVKTIKNIEENSNAVQKISTDNTSVNRTGNTKSTTHTFTVKRGSVPGQFVLTSDKSNRENIPISNLQQSPDQRSHIRTNLATSPGSTGCTLSLRGLPKIRQKSYSNKQGQMKAEIQKFQTDSYEIQNSSKNNLSIIFPTQNVEIPETQSNVNDITLTFCSNKEQHVVVVPFNQTISKVNNQEKDNINIKNQQIRSCDLTARNKSFLQQANDTLQLNDILTDDEENTTESALQRAQRGREIPLNLISNSYNLRKTNKQKLYKNFSQQLVSEPEDEIAPPAYTKEHINIKRCRPLNRPPGIPLNGEKYAQELARMSNYEILDLRKRNSMGQIFVISDHKSRCSATEVHKKTHQLADQIEQELLKRNLGNATQHPNYQLNEEQIDGERLPVPYNFRDSVTAQDNEHSLQDSCFIDETSSDRIKFKSNKCKLSKRKTPEILKQYLGISKRYSKKINRKSINRSSRRSLYNTRIAYLSDEHNGSNEERTSGVKLQKLSYLKSPPNIQNNLVRTPKAVSPPPVTTPTSGKQTTDSKRRRDVVTTSTITGEIQNSPYKIHADEVAVSTTTDERQNTSNNIHYIYADKNLTIPPPPPGFENDSSVSPNNTNQYTTNITLELRTTSQSITNNLNNNNNDDHLFKKPTKLAPKKKVDSPLKVPQETTEDNQGSISSTADLTDCTLRRSKRRQVQRIPPPIIGILYQQERERFQKRFQKSKLKKKREANEKNNKLGSSKKQNENLLSSASENDDGVSDCENRVTKSVKKANYTKIKSKQNHNAAALMPNTPPPVECLNDVFDKLKKQNSSTSNATTKRKTPQCETKPFKICVRRLKPSEITPCINSASNISNSSNSNTNIELVSWLKNMSEALHTDQQVVTSTLKDMRISSAKKLCFTELEGVEYAFYDTAESSSLGYLRFKPFQTKPKKKTKHFDLQFLNLMGLFRITVNNDESVLDVGDVAVIKRSAYYDIKNLSDDVGILMVVKKQCL